MERIQSLIVQLNQQNVQGASNAEMLVTVQLLELELIKSQEKPRPAATSKVAVTLPSNWKAMEEKHAAYMPPPATVETEVMADEPVVENAAPVKLYSVGAEDRTPALLAVDEHTAPAYEHPRQPVAPFHNHIAATNDLFHAEQDAPTLVQHHTGKELNELIAERKESLNERLKQGREELVNVLKDVPIKDLRKGIGINDRFRFLSELFRNDEPMYERSIKTINSFKVFSEAEYWINRELKFKLGWDDTKDTVQHFYHLVRRRFS